MKEVRIENRIRWIEDMNKGKILMRLEKAKNDGGG